MRSVARGLAAAALCAVALAACAGLPGPGGVPFVTENDIISTPLVPVTCLGAIKGIPIYSGPSRQSFVLGYTGAQVGATGQTGQGFIQILFRRDQPGWVPSEATGSFRRPGFPTVRCSVAGIRPNGEPVFLYH